MTEIFNRQALLHRVDGDEELVEEMLAIFLEYTPPQLVEIHQAIEAGDAPGLQGKAHSIKGAAAGISAPAVEQAAGLLEAAGRNRDLDLAGRHFAALAREFSRFQEALAR
jgi:HPt (histidine-containing phosphotransfer) domain-containing protein